MKTESDTVLGAWTNMSKQIILLHNKQFYQISDDYFISFHLFFV